MAEVKDLILAYPYGELTFSQLSGTDEAYAELDLQNISNNEKIAFKINTVDLFEVDSLHGIIEPDSTFKINVTFKSTQVSINVFITTDLTNRKAKTNPVESIPCLDGKIYSRCPSYAVIIRIKRG